MRTTLKDVARASGCSFQAVSAILGSRAHEFSEELRVRVVTEAARLGYRPNASARSMRSGRTGCVAVLKGTHPHNSSLSTTMLGGLLSEVDRRDLQLVILELDDERLTSPEQFPRILREAMADGLLIKVDTRIPPRLGELVRHFSIPAIWLNSHQGADNVRPDDLAAGALATRHLLALGHTRIAYADFANDLDDADAHYSVHERLVGCRDAATDGGVALRVLPHAGRVAGGERLAVAERALAAPDRPTAIVAANTWSALPIWHAALRLGMAVPRDLSLIVMDEQIQDHFGQALTQLRVPEQVVGRTAVEMLAEKLRAPGASLPERVVPFELLDGATCAAPSV